MLGRRSYNRILPFSTTLNDPSADFKGTPLFDVDCLRHDKVETYSYNGIMTAGTYTQWCIFWVISSDLAYFPTTPSIARLFCDSWAFCWLSHRAINEWVNIARSSSSSYHHHHHHHLCRLMVSWQIHLLTYYLLSWLGQHDYSGGRGQFDSRFIHDSAVGSSARPDWYNKKLSYL